MLTWHIIKDTLNWHLETFRDKLSVKYLIFELVHFNIFSWLQQNASLQFPTIGEKTSSTVCTRRVMTM